MWSFRSGTDMWGGEGWPSPPKTLGRCGKIELRHPNDFGLKGRNCIFGASRSIFRWFCHPNFFDHVRPCFRSLRDPIFVEFGSVLRAEVPPNLWLKYFKRWDQNIFCIFFDLKTSKNLFLVNFGPKFDKSIMPDSIGEATWILLLELFVSKCFKRWD